ncbi:TPM domain-containing protein [Paenibacillus sp. sgz5001063]|uniref:TPM domain-containing protein n=1 Tax=Paenibacillus sp. sgz5001063 TaxID=3242474 RepID=UPI0036D247EC
MNRITIKTICLAMLFSVMLLPTFSFAQTAVPDHTLDDYGAGAYKTYNPEPLGTTNFVGDNAGVFTQVTRDDLNQSGNRYQLTTHSGVYVVTVKNLGDKSLEDYTYAKFASMGAGPDDVMLVLDVSGDNYYVLQGKGIDGILTNDIVSDILSAKLEPLFAQKNYAAGATATVNAFYSFFLTRADNALNATTPAVTSSEPVHSEPLSFQSTHSTSASVSDTVTYPLTKSEGYVIMALFLLVFVFSIVLASRRNRYMALYGVPVNPYSNRSTDHGDGGPSSSNRSSGSGNGRNR